MFWYQRRAKAFLTVSSPNVAIRIRSIILNLSPVAGMFNSAHFAATESGDSSIKSAPIVFGFVVVSVFMASILEFLGRNVNGKNEDFSAIFPAFG